MGESFFCQAGKKELEPCTENMISLSVFLLLLVFLFPAHCQENEKALVLADGRKFFCQAGNWKKKDGESHCRGQGLVLPIVKDLTTAEKILEKCKIKDYGFWVDAEQEHHGNYFKWSTGSTIDNKDPIWNKINPSYDGKCVEWRINTEGKWALNDVSCDIKRWLVCEQRTQ